MYNDEDCVYRAADIGEADIIVAWLSERDIAAEVKDRSTASTFPVPGIVAPAGIEVCVVDSAQAEKARELLREHFKELEREHPPGSADRTVEATCEGCGKTASFPGDQAGTVQSCPHCGAYVDVPE